MNKWLELDGSLFMFGVGGITRVEPLGEGDRYVGGRKIEYNTSLYQGTTRITIVKDTVEEIKKLLTESN